MQPSRETCGRCRTQPLVLDLSFAAWILTCILKAIWKLQQLHFLELVYFCSLHASTVIWNGNQIYNFHFVRVLTPDPCSDVTCYQWTSYKLQCPSELYASPIGNMLSGYACPLSPYVLFDQVRVLHLAMTYLVAYLKDCFEMYVSLWSTSQKPQAQIWDRKLVLTNSPGSHHTLICIFCTNWLLSFYCFHVSRKINPQ